MLCLDLVLTSILPQLPRTQLASVEGLTVEKGILVCGHVVDVALMVTHLVYSWHCSVGYKPCGAQAH